MSGPNDQKPVVAKLKYVGWVEEILELNYGILNFVILLCNWMKTNYIKSSATMKRNEYGFTIVNFGSLIPISNQSFTFPLSVDQVFFFNDCKERGWKVVIKKEPCGRRVIDKVQTDLTKFDMFKLENLDAYVGLQGLISIDESIQLVVIVGGYTMITTYLVINVPNGGEDDGTENVKESVTTFSSDS